MWVFVCVRERNEPRGGPSPGRRSGAWLQCFASDGSCCSLVQKTGNQSTARLAPLGTVSVICHNWLMFHPPVTVFLCVWSVKALFCLICSFQGILAVFVTP